MKHRLFKLVLFLLLGAIVNIAVAWGFAISTPSPISLPKSPDAQYGLLERVVKHPSGRFISRVDRRPGELTLRQMQPVPCGSGLTRIDESRYNKFIPTWSSFRYTEPLADHYNRTGCDSLIYRYEEYASGWPLLTLFSKHIKYLEIDNGAAIMVYPETDGFLLLPKWLKISDRRDSVPLHPIWQGFAINTSFYAAILWLLSLGPFTARRMIRRKQGRCTKCGYDLRGAEHEVCPECGAGVP